MTQGFWPYPGRLEIAQTIGAMRASELMRTDGSRSLIGNRDAPPGYAF